MPKTPSPKTTTAAASKEAQAESLEAQDGSSTQDVGLAEETPTVRDFVSKHAITMTIKPVTRNPHMDMPIGSSHYECALHMDARTMKVPFSQGPAVKGAPDAASVLDCLASDSSSFENNHSFEDWCAEYGYDSDSRKHEKTFKAVEKEAAALQKFLGSRDLYEELIWNTERL